MNDKLDKCCHRLGVELKSAEGRLVDAGQHLATAAGSEVATIEEKLSTAVAVRDTKKGEASEAAHRIKHFIEEKKDAAISRYEDWKTDREIKKIEEDASDCEDHAADAIMAAAFAIQEAEVAIIEALRARKMAIEVAG